MGGKGSKEGEQLSQRELNYYMGVQTTPAAASTTVASSFVPRQVQLRPTATTPASTRPTITASTVSSTVSASATSASTRPTTTSTVAPTISASATTASTRPTKTTSVRSTTTSASSTTSNLTAKSAVAAAKWRPVGCTPASDDEEDAEEDQVNNDRSTPRKVLTARRATATQPAGPPTNHPPVHSVETPSANPLNLSQTTYDDPYGYIAEAVRRTAEEVNKRQAASRPTPSPRTTPPATAAPALPVVPTPAAPSQPTSTGTWWPTDIEHALSRLSVEEQQPAAAAAAAAAAPAAPAARVAVVDPFTPAAPKVESVEACSSSDLKDYGEWDGSFELHGPKARRCRTKANPKLLPAPRMVNGENLAVYNMAEIMKANRAAAEAEDAAEAAYLEKLRRIRSTYNEQSTSKANTSSFNTASRETAKKYYPFDDVLSKEEWEKHWREMDEERSRERPQIAYMDRDGDIDFGPDIEPWQLPYPGLNEKISYKPAPMKTVPTAFQPVSKPWEVDSADDEPEQLPSRPGARHVAGSRQVARTAATTRDAPRPSQLTPSTSTSYRWPADIDEALSRLSLADANSGISSQRKAPLAAVRRGTTASAAVSTHKPDPASSALAAASTQRLLNARAAPLPAAAESSTLKTATAAAASAQTHPDAPLSTTRPAMVAEAIESVKSAPDWKTLLKRHAELKEANRRVMNESRTAVAPPIAPSTALSSQTAANTAASTRQPPDEPALSGPNPSWRKTHEAPRVPKATVPIPTKSESYPSACPPYRFDYDPEERVQSTSRTFWKSDHEPPKAVVSATSAAREFAAAASPRPVFQASSSDSSEEEEEDEESDYAGIGPVAPVDSDLMERFNKAMSDNPTLIRKLESMRSLSNLTHASLCESDTPVYTLSVGNKHVCVFEPGREKIIRCKRENLELPDIEEGQIYRSTYITKESLGDFFLPTDRYRDQLTDRPSFIYSSPELYRQLIIPALLLGSRVRDFEQRCATVVQLGDLVLNMPAQNNKRMKGKPLKLKTISGIIFEVRVKAVIACDADKRWVVECEAPEQPLPRKVRIGALLEMLGSYDAQPRVTGALMSYYAGSRFNFHIKSGKQKRERPADIGNWHLLECIYGPPHSDRYFPPVNSANPMIHLAKNGGVVQLNPQQAEAVARYNCPLSPAFVVESPPGSGKTMTAAAMAVSYKGDGVQLFLSTANVPVINMALALAKLDYGSLKAIHFISSEREDLMTEETRSPFSVISLAKANAEMNEQITALEQQLAYAPNDEEKDKIKAAIVKACGPVFADTYDIYFATVDMILGRLFKKNHNGKAQPDTIKKQLTSFVRRIVVDEASQLTEAALNALILSFPQAQIVLIGDSKQLPPFRYSPRDVVSKLAARPALEVIKDKLNLPVITLSRVYRASPSMMAHYSECFYEGGLESFKPESVKSLLSCFGSRSKGSKCLFWKVDKGVAKKWGTSKFNYAEITSLRYIVNILKNSGYSEKEVMIISYYEAQRKKAEEELKELGDYELLTVDSAQGREKKIVIVLTTRTSVPVTNDHVQAGEFFTCALRCNVAVSRHQEALIVLGHPSIAYAPNWARVLSPKYFRHVDDTRSFRPGWARN